MNRKITFVLGFMLFAAIASHAQKSKIYGKVETLEHMPLAYATVSLENTALSTLTDEEGNFLLTAPDRTYSLVVTYAGYAAITKKITVENKKDLNVGTLVLEASEEELKEVVVSDILKNKFSKKESLTPSRMPLGNMETPTVYNMVNKDLLQELSATDFNGAMAVLSGTVSNEAANSNGQNVTMRGFAGGATFRNGLYVNPRTQTEIYNLDRIEVMKGPSGTLFGAISTYGGAVNVATKKPFESFRGEVGYVTGSWGLNRFTADINTPLNKSRTALARVNTLFTTQNSFQDVGMAKAFGVSISLLFNLSDKTSVSFDGEIYAPTRILNGFVRNPEVLTNKSMKQFAPLYRRNFSGSDIATTRSTYFASTELKHKFNDHWMSVTGYQHGESVENESVFMVLRYENDKEVTRQIRPFDYLRVTTDNIQQDFIGDFKIGQFRNRMVLGASYSLTTDHSQNGLFINNGKLSTFAPYDRVALHPDSAWTPVSLSDVHALKREKTVSYTGKSSSLSAYVSDVFNILPNLNVMASLRIDNYKSYKTVESGISQNDEFTQVQLSPKFGIVYQPVMDKVTLFANYVNGFSNVSPSLDDNGNIKKWKPEQSDQLEGGVKLNLLEGKLSSTLSYYKIEVKDMVRNIDERTQVQDGNLKSQGIEFEIITSPVRGLNLVAGYGYNHNKYIVHNKDSENKRAPYTPEKTASLWASYKFLDGKIKGFGFGGGFTHVDKVFSSLKNEFYVPAYTVANFTAFYDQPKYRIGLKLNNALDKLYWNFYGQPQKPRELMANFTFKF